MRMMEPAGRGTRPRLGVAPTRFRGGLLHHGGWRGVASRGRGLVCPLAARPAVVAMASRVWTGFWIIEAADDDAAIEKTKQGSLALQRVARCGPSVSDPTSDDCCGLSCRRPPRAIPRNLADAVVRPRCPGPLGCLRRSGHKRLEGVWSSPVVVPIERKDRGGHPTGRRDLDEDRVWCQRRDHARWLSNDRGFSDVLHLAPNALDCGEQRGPGCRCPDGRRTGHALFSRLRRPLGFWPEWEHHRWTAGVLQLQTARRPLIGHPPRKLLRWNITVCQ